MAWKLVKNSEPDFKDIQFIGKCPRYFENATVTVHYAGRKMCKADLQKTYNEVGRKCDVLEQTENVSFASCIQNCPLVTN